MNVTLTQAQEQLKVALNRLENSVNERVKALEAEIATLKSKPIRAKKVANSTPKDEFDNTLNELRKLVGQG